MHLTDLTLRPVSTLGKSRIGIRVSKDDGKRDNLNNIKSIIEALLNNNLSPGGGAFD